MKSAIFSSYFSLGISLFLLFNLPISITDSFRNTTIYLMNQPLKLFQWIHLFPKEKVDKEEYDSLKTENFLLKSEIKEIGDYLKEQSILEELVVQLDNLDVNVNKKQWKIKEELIIKRLFYLCKSVRAKVIFREPVSWGSFIWINKGEEENKRLSQTVIAKNSPVVIGDKVVGVVEEVFLKRSKVRLITDENLHISVCSHRGSYQKDEIVTAIESLQRFTEEEEELKQVLNRYKNKLDTKQDHVMIARGEVSGFSQPLWSVKKSFLKGIGFHPILNKYKHESNFFQVGDLLLTSGLDGVFPEGLIIGSVKTVLPLSEGSFYYQMEVQPSILYLESVTNVMVLPPVQEYEY
ncbi:MAG: hypothetical protein HY860_01980 [Chlamydiales bacterium]|nr:hypothetical protein [Chlamydiales bacterium]